MRVLSREYAVPQQLLIRRANGVAFIRGRSQLIVDDIVESL